MVAPLVPQLVFTVGRRLIATHLVKNIVMMPAVAPVLSATTAVPASVAVGTVAAPLSLSGGVPIAMLLGAITTIVPLLKRVMHNTTARHRGIPKQQATEEEIAAPVATASLADNADHLYLTIAAMLLILGLTFATERLMKGQRSLEILDDREIEEKGKIISASDAKLSSEREKKREEDDGEDEPTTISTLTDEDEHVSADNISVSAPTVQQSSTKRRISAWQRVVEPKKKMPQVIPARKKMERPPSPSPPAALPTTPVQGSHPYDVKQIDRIRRLDERKAMERRSRSEANAATKIQCAVRRTSAEKDVLRRLLVQLEEERALLKDQEVAEEERDRRQKEKAAEFLGDAPSTPPESIITPRSAPPSMSMFRKKPGIGNSYTTATGAVVDFQSVDAPSRSIEALRRKHEEMTKSMKRASTPPTVVKESAFSWTDVAGWQKTTGQTQEAKLEMEEAEVKEEEQRPTVVKNLIKEFNATTMLNTWGVHPVRDSVTKKQ